MSRPKGSLNRDTRTVREKLDAIGCDPIKGLAMFAMGDVVGLGIMTQEEFESQSIVRIDDKGRMFIVSGRQAAKAHIPPTLQLKALGDLTQYVEPKRAALQVSGNPDAPMAVVILPSNGRESK